MEIEEAIRKLIREKLKNLSPKEIKMLAAANNHVRAKHKKKKKS